MGAAVVEELRAVGGHARLDASGVAAAAPFEGPGLDGGVRDRRSAHATGRALASPCPAARHGAVRAGVAAVARRLPARPGPMRLHGPALGRRGAGAALLPGRGTSPSVPVPVAGTRVAAAPAPEGRP